MTLRRRAALLLQKMGRQCHRFSRRVDPQLSRDQMREFLQKQWARS